MSESDMKREIDHAKHEILSILSGKVPPADIRRIENILNEIKSKISRGLL